MGKGFSDCLAWRQEDVGNDAAKPSWALSPFPGSGHRGRLGTPQGTEEALGAALAEPLQRTFQHTGEARHRDELTFTQANSGARSILLEGTSAANF